MKMPIIYKMKPEEMQFAKDYATYVYNESRKSKLNSFTVKKANKSEALGWGIVGYGAEIAWSKICGVEFKHNMNEFHEIPDDGIHEIRSSAHPSGGLIVRENDSIDRKYIFAKFNSNNEYYFYGWMYGKEVRQPKYYFNPNNWKPAWRVDKEHLHPITENEIDACKKARAGATFL